MIPSASSTHRPSSSFTNTPRIILTALWRSGRISLKGSSITSVRVDTMCINISRHQSIVNPAHSAPHWSFSSSEVGITNMNPYLPRLAIHTNRRLNFSTALRASSSSFFSSSSVIGITRTAVSSDSAKLSACSRVFFRRSNQSSSVRLTSARSSSRSFSFERSLVFSFDTTYPLRTMLTIPFKISCQLFR